MSDVTPPAGWYTDPENSTGERWWNGSGWSDQKRAATPEAGFRYGSAAPLNAPGDASTDGSSAARPDPYAAPQTYPAASPYVASPYVAAPYGSPAYGSRSNGLAIAGLIVSAGGWIVLGVLASIAGIILSAFGLARAKQAEAAGNPNSGRGIAMAGLVIGIVVTVLGILVVVGYFAFILATIPAGVGY
jgi:hypothetical protein